MKRISIVKHLRKYDPLIIERMIGLVLGPSTTMYRSFLKHCTLTNKAVGDYMTGLVQTSSEERRPRSSSLLVGTPLVLGPELASRRTEHSLLWRMSLYIFDILFFHFTCLCNNFYGLSALVGCWSSAFIRKIIYKFLNACPFDYTAFAVSGKVGIT